MDLTQAPNPGYSIRNYTEDTMAIEIELKARTIDSRVHELIRRRFKQYGDSGRPYHLYISPENWAILRESPAMTPNHGTYPGPTTYMGLLVHLVPDEAEHLNVI